MHKKSKSSKPLTKGFKKLIFLTTTSLVIISSAFLLIHNRKHKGRVLSASSGNTYYVSKDSCASDDKNGLYADCSQGGNNGPFRTIQKGADMAIAGDTVKILPGIYGETVTVKNSGTSGQEITFLGQGEKEEVIIDGTGIDMSTLALFNMTGKSYINLQNLTIRNSSKDCLKVDKTYSPEVKTTNITLSNLRIENCETVGMYLKWVDYLTVQNNYIANIRASSGIGIWNCGNISADPSVTTAVIVENNTIYNAHMLPESQGGHEETLTVSGTKHFEVKNNNLDFDTTLNVPTRIGIDVKGESQYGKVYNNYVHNMSGPCIYLDTWDDHLHHIQIFQNTSKYCSEGIHLGAERSTGLSEYIDVFNNIVINSVNSGIDIPNAHGNGRRQHIKIFNNTVYGHRGCGGAGVYVTSENIEDISIKNNISYFQDLTGQDRNCVQQAAVCTETILQHVTAEANLVYGPKRCSLDCPSCYELPNTITADPEFVNLSDDDFHLQETSAAIDAGTITNIGFPPDPLLPLTFDFDGRTRPWGTAYDIGAFEYYEATPSQYDLNNDTIVNSTDLRIILQNWNSVYTQGDFNSDGVANLIDFGILFNNLDT